MLRILSAGALALALLIAHGGDGQAAGYPIVTGKCGCAIGGGLFVATCARKGGVCTRAECAAACQAALPKKTSALQITDLSAAKRRTAPARSRATRDTYETERPKRPGHDFRSMWSDSASLAPTDVSAARRVRKARPAPAAVAVGAMDRDGRYVAAPSPQTRQRAPVVARTAVRGAVIGGQAGVMRVCAGSSCGTVAAWAADKFRGLFADLAALGHRLGSPGCLSGGHMRNSLHHWGGACDLFNQVARNRTALPQPPPSVQIELAAKHGLTSGCGWRSPDCGHFDLSGIGMGRRYARNGAHRG